MKSLLAVVLVALALPAAAGAHATLVRTAPANGAVLARAPAAVRIVFDDVVRVSGGIDVVRNQGGRSVLGGKPHVVDGLTLVIPLQHDLADGAYSARWAIVSDDGHIESGVLAFAVGLGRAPPTTVLQSEGTSPRAPDVIARWLFLAGTLVAVGVALFALGLRIRDERVALVLTSACVFAALGAADEAHRVGLSTRAGTTLVAGSVGAVVVALLAAAATLAPRVLPAALVGALPLAVVPTISGHALDRGVPRINVAADVLHVVGAATWIGALVGAIVFRRIALRLALSGVALLALTGVVRAWYELLDVSQLWDIAYGRVLLVKTGVLLAAIALGVWRRRAVELVLVAGLVVAVSFLVLEQPGRTVTPAAAAAAPLEPSPPPPAQPPGAVVLAHESGVYGVALAVEPQRQTVTVLSPAGGGMSGLDVTVNGRAAEPCGSGCYRAEAPRAERTTVAVDGVRSVFAVPRDTPNAGALVARLQARYRALRSVEYVELLSSGPRQGIVARWRLERPNRFSYSIAGGAQAVVLGSRRWDRDTPTAAWRRSEQTPPLPQPATQWQRATNAHLLDENVVSFVDPSTPAFFTVHFDPKSLRPSLVEMTAAAHFMSDGYVRFDSGPALRPPR